MKKIIPLVFILCILSVIATETYPGLDKIGDSGTYNVSTNNGEVVYTKECIVTYWGKNKTIGPGQVGISAGTNNEVYSYSEPTAIFATGNTYSFDTKKCWVCGKYIACLSKLDGGLNIADRPNEFKCNASNYPVIRSGESGFIHELTTNTTDYERSDIGVI